MLRCHHIFCFCCFTKWFLGSKQNCPVCYDSVSIKDIKSVHFEAINVSPGVNLDFVLVQKNLKNHKLELVGNEGDKAFFQKSFPITFSKFEKMVLREIEELHCVQVSDPLITEFCQYVSMQFISNRDLIAPPPSLGKRKTPSETKTYKEDFAFYYQQAQGFNVFVHPVSFDFLCDEYGGWGGLPTRLSLTVKSVEKVTKSTFNSYFWSIFGHLGKNCEFLLTHVDFSKAYPKVKEKHYSDDLKAFQLANTQAPTKRAPKIRKKSYASSEEEEMPFVIEIQPRRKVNHKKINRWNEKKATRLEENLKLKAEELFEMAVQSTVAETGSPHIAAEKLSENGLIFPPLETQQNASEMDLFQKMAEKEKERLAQAPPKKSSAEDSALKQQAEQPENNFIIITKKPKNKKQKKTVKE